MKVKIKPEDLESIGLFRKVRITLETEGELMLFHQFISQLTNEMAATFGIPREETNDVIFNAYGKLNKAININCIAESEKYENIFEIKSLK